MTGRRGRWLLAQAAALLVPAGALAGGVSLSSDGRTLMFAGHGHERNEIRVVYNPRSYNEGYSVSIEDKAEPSRSIHPLAASCHHARDYMGADVPNAVECRPTARASFQLGRGGDYFSVGYLAASDVPKLTVEGGPGKDTLNVALRARADGGPGDDALYGSAGVQTLRGSEGGDSFVTTEPPGSPIAGDYVNCGPGKDRVIADAEDHVRRNCEKVTRRNRR